ncbi:MAG: PilZ domain-containing protein [bacterium]|nr:PilZ domain-containing protein [bacterium]
MSKDVEPLPDNRKFEGVVYDISGGGIAIMEKSEKTVLPFAIIDRLELNIHFPENSLHMNGVVLNIRKHQNADIRVFGIEFSQENIGVVEMKRNVTKIMHYVMKRQREIIFA